MPQLWRFDWNDESSSDEWESISSGANTVDYASSDMEPES